MSKNLNRPSHRLLNMAAFILFIIASMIVCIYSLIPSSTVGVEMSDKILHFVTYGGLAGLLLLARPYMRLLLPIKSLIQAAPFWLFFYG